MTLSDPFWVNIRYLMIAAGVALLVRQSKGLLTEEQATSLVVPLVEMALGALLTLGGWVWGNYVRKGTKTVPVETAARPDVPTVSAATGQVEKPTEFTG